MIIIFYNILNIFRLYQILNMLFKYRLLSNLDSHNDKYIF